MLKKLHNYEPTEKSLWQGRKDSLPGERFFQQVRIHDLTQHALKKSESEEEIVVLGFCSDEGIRRNKGRIGAQSGPFELREQLAKLACHTNKSIIDIGNIRCRSELEVAQQEFAQLIHYSKERGYKTLAMGGGHEIAWGHFQGLTTQYPQLGIINFDAHFDLRPLQEGKYATSGTPFQQMAEYCAKNQLVFSYCCLGIQPDANTKSLFASANALRVPYLTAEQINQESFAWQTTFLDKFMRNHKAIYLTLCLDVFAECFAPGVSAPQAMGLTPWQVFFLIKYILQTGKVVSLDIAELSPPLDQGQKTARLAANLVAALLNYY